MTIYRFYLQVIFFMICCLAIICLPAYLMPLKPLFLDNFTVPTIQISTCTNLLAYLFTLAMMNRFDRYIRVFKMGSLINILFGSYSVLIIVIFISRLPYSIAILVIGFFVSIINLSLLVKTNINKSKLRLAIVPSGITDSFKSIKLHQYYILNKSHAALWKVSYLKTFDGLVVDFRTGDLNHEWESFVAHAAINGVPVYSAYHLYESITGRVDIKHLMENNFGVLAPSKLYMSFKRLIESLLILIFYPMIILLSLLVALIVSRDGHGKVLFVQERIGLAGKKFVMYKFRTMKPHDSRRPQKLSVDHHRVTPVGAKLRKYRLDELPQLWNVLKGDMSLIGPRPETAVLHAQYERDLPFYIYRSIIRPGITGWAQVMHGYTSNSHQTSTKLTYDFYYIKHFSFWLDLLIVFRTIRVIFSGFGAK